MYLDVVDTLEKDSFLNCFFRFGSRRGCPRTLTSDRGTNFIGAAKEIQDATKDFDHSKISNSVAKQDTEWILHPPKASHEWSGGTSY